MYMDQTNNTGHVKGAEICTYGRKSEDTFDIAYQWFSAAMNVGA
jgi:hypothetical protein